jgi:hypothetical protein
MRNGLPAWFPPLLRFGHGSGSYRVAAAIRRLVRCRGKLCQGKAQPLMFGAAAKEAKPA